MIPKKQWPVVKCQGCELMVEQTIYKGKARKFCSVACNSQWRSRQTVAAWSEKIEGGKFQ